MTAVMVCLVGEQPMPNLLAARHLRPPDVVLAFTDKSRERCERLRAVLSKQCTVFPVAVTAYDIHETERQLDDFLSNRGWSPSDVVFNVSGGTKPMSFAAYRLAERWRAPLIYVETGEGAETEVHRYAFSKDGSLAFESSESLPKVITIDDYLRVHLGPYTAGGHVPPQGREFEQEVAETLKPLLDETVSNVRHRAIDEIDLVLRHGNQVGVAELKVGQITKHGVEQLILACRRETLGTYTRKFLIVGSTDPTRTNILDVARASDVTVIDLPSYQGPGSLSTADRDRLSRQVLEALHP